MGMDDCDDNGNCINLQGAYLCRCRDGYFGTGYTCKPFDEEPTVMTIGRPSDSVMSLEMWILLSYNYSFR
jgi:hypothetical protein